MAVLAVAGLGALGSSALGFGWQAGWLIGSAVGSSLFGPRLPDQEGPRLSDLSVSSSAYGAPIPIVYGTMRMSGNVIWSSGLREEKTSQKIGGKGGGGQKATSYSYYTSLALAFAEGSADSILRLWADGKLIHDRGDASPEISKPWLKLRFYSGDEVQLPDPLIEAAEGAGQVPAHRGLCYIVIEDMPLADFGNRIPSFSAEISFAAEPSWPTRPTDLLTPGEGGLLESYARSDLAPDWSRGFVYMLTTALDPATSGLRRFRLDTMVEDRQATIVEITGDANSPGFPGALHCGRDGALYFTLGGSNSAPILRVDPDAFRETARFGSPSSGLSNTDQRFVATTRMSSCSAYGPNGLEQFLLTGSIFDDLGLLRARDMSYIWGAGQAVAEARIVGLVGGRTGQAATEGWVLGSNTTATNHQSLRLYRLRIGLDAGFYGDAAWGVTEFAAVAAFTAQDFDAAATGFYGGAVGLLYDTGDDSVLFQVRLSMSGAAGDVYMVKWRSGDGIVWATKVPGLVNHAARGFPASRITGQSVAFATGSRVTRLDLATGAVASEAVWPGLTIDGAQSYDGQNATLLVHDVSSGWTRLLLDRGSGEGAALSDIVADLCRRGGLGSADIDTGDLSALSVPGYVLGRPTGLRQAIEPLGSAFFFDAVESDAALRFRARGRLPARSIPASDLLPLEGASGESWRETRAMEVDLPARVTVIHADRSGDYQQGSQSARRIAATMASRNAVILELPMALTAETAKRAADKMLSAAWTGRSSFNARLPPDYLALDPTDVIDLVLEDGTTFRVRLTRLDIGADYSLALEAVSERAASYASEAVADPGSGRPRALIGGVPATRLILPDMPLLRDQDDSGGAASRLYAMTGGYGGPGWPGASLYQSPDTITWDRIGAQTREMAWGAAANALGEPLSPFATDEVNALTVFMTAGAERLAGVTQEAMLNGANAALLLRADGAPEVIQFRDVEVKASGAFTLRGLLRGRRGTDVFVTGHAAGETFVLLEPGTMEATLLALGDLGLTRHWRAVGAGGLFDEAPVLSRVLTGRDLMPYAPVHLRAEAAGADIRISWVRRSRLGGAWQDGSGEVILGEAAEAYEVDILDGPGGAVLRTLRTTSPSVPYAQSDIAADFGAMPATLSLVVCQISAVVGRGFPRTATLEIV